MDDEKLSAYYEAMMNQVSIRMSKKISLLFCSAILETERLDPFLKNGTLSIAGSTTIGEDLVIILRGIDGREVVLSIVMPPNNVGNRAVYGEVYLNKHTRLKGNPSTIEMLVVSPTEELIVLVPGWYKEYYATVMTFHRDDSQIEYGFSRIIDEIIKIYNIINAENIDIIKSQYFSDYIFESDSFC